MTTHVARVAHDAQRLQGIARALAALVSRLAVLVSLERRARPMARAGGWRGDWRNAQGTRAGVVSSAVFVHRTLR